MDNIPSAVFAFTLGWSLAQAQAAAAQTGVAPPGRFEETSPLVTWAGAWSENSLPAHSGGSARLAMDAGAAASITFTGSAVTWIGYRDEWGGLAEVLLDGAVQATVDTYASPARARAALHSIDGLRERRHTLTIRAKGTHAPESAGSWVWIDAFVVGEEPADAAPPPSGPRRLRAPDPSGDAQAPAPRSRPGRRTLGPRASRFEQDHAAVVWSGPWSTNLLAVHGGHSARLSMEATSRVDFAFTGTGVSWIGYQDEWSGIADVLLDGRPRARVDTYSKRARAQVELHAIDGLPAGPHTLTIQPTGRSRPASGGAWIWVDAFAVTR